ncbi:hypothetical protein ACFXTO_002134 [Malus domestica]
MTRKKELCDLRTLFTEKYGNSLQHFLNKEFVERLKSKPPTKEMKIQLMQDIAWEFSIEWDSKALEQKLYTSPTPDQGQHSCDDEHQQQPQQPQQHHGVFLPTVPAPARPHSQNPPFVHRRRLLHRREKLPPTSRFSSRDLLRRLHTGRQCRCRPARLRNLQKSPKLPPPAAKNPPFSLSGPSLFIFYRRNHDAEDKLSHTTTSTASKGNKIDLKSQASKGDSYDRYKLQSNSEDETTSV